MTIKEVKKQAADLNEVLRNCSIKEEHKTFIVSAIMLALTDEDFKKEYQIELKAEKSGRFIFDTVKDVLDDLLPGKTNKKSRETMLDSFGFIKTLTTLEKPQRISMDGGEGSVFLLQFFTERIEETIFDELENTKDYDLLGTFYQEFASYNGGDGNGLGIVLTPTHICNIMARLADLNPKDTILDLCTGSTSLLIAALNDILKKDKDKTFDINKNLIGIELSNQLFTVGMTNLLLRNEKGSIPRLIPGSCFDVELEGFKPQPTKLIINPPYSQCKGASTSHLHELNFLLHGLDTLEKNGKGVAIFPVSCFTKNGKIEKDYKKKLMAKHTLESVITMPEQLFYPVGTQVIVCVFTAGIPHPAKKKTLLYNFKNDGFEIDRIEGRKDQGNAETLTTELFDCIDLKTTNNKLTFVELTKDDEWCFESHKPTSMPTELAFRNKLKDFILFELEGEVNEKINDEK